jgi:hypothetical protein
MNSDGKFNPDNDWSVTDEEASTSEAAAIWAGDRVIAFAVYSSKGFYRDSHPSIDANARLIAAAPDLLSCLIEMVEVHDEPCHLDHHGCCQSHFLDDVNDGGCRVANARAAIAKATGEKS